MVSWNTITQPPPPICFSINAPPILCEKKSFSKFLETRKQMFKRKLLENQEKEPQKNSKIILSLIQETPPKISAPFLFCNIFGKWVSCIGMGQLLYSYTHPSSPLFLCNIIHSIYESTLLTYCFLRILLYISSSLFLLLFISMSLFPYSYSICW